MDQTKLEQNCSTVKIYSMLYIQHTAEQRSIDNERHYRQVDILMWQFCPQVSTINVRCATHVPVNVFTYILCRE